MIFFKKILLPLDIYQSKIKLTASLKKVWTKYKIYENEKKNRWLLLLS